MAMCTNGDPMFSENQLPEDWRAKKVYSTLSQAKKVSAKAAAGAAMLTTAQLQAELLQRLPLQKELANVNIPPLVDALLNQVGLGSTLRLQDLRQKHMDLLLTIRAQKKAVHDVVGAIAKRRGHLSPTLVDIISVEEVIEEDEMFTIIAGLEKERAVPAHEDVDYTEEEEQREDDVPIDDIVDGDTEEPEEISEENV